MRKCRPAPRLAVQGGGSLNDFPWHRAAAILLAIFAVVILAEIVVTIVRKRIL
jgi:ABC-type phosphate/phosphonate transport system permease subunit